MFTVPKYQPRITYIHRDGTKKVFDSIDHVIREFGRNWLAHNVGPDFTVEAYRDYWGQPYYSHFEAILRDDQGQPVLVEPTPRGRRYRNRFACWDGTGPVPGTGRQHGGHWFRSPRTHDAHRLAVSVIKEEGEPPIRAKRNPRHIPSSWDDLPIGANRNRNWKRHRKTQWRG